ncbi:sulfite exporter TauE/SafE family protein [Endozoicomonas arenosclerae]|uniref:sulfite exporter TauE/SafE family protein n=1 Tax=Endozoicomonas arenosclerae TaxID=1633495 RepID=UPI000785AAAA|nr:sulfite exporter TauE/SafE family protein [Endozoicomonas arenosclerae]
MLSVLIFALAGLVSGFIAGLFGLGGGLTMVPLLVYLLPYFLSGQEGVMHLAVGSSVACVMCNALSSTWHRSKAGDMLWPLFHNLFVSVAIGTVLGILIAAVAPGALLKYAFSIVVTVVLVREYLAGTKKKKTTEEGKLKVSNFWKEKLTGCMTGIVGAITGGGAGLIMTPYYLHLNYSIRQAAAQSAAQSAIIGLVATLGYLFTPLGVNEKWVVGSLYLPAIIGLTPFGFLGSRGGVWFSQRVSEQKLHFCFCSYLLIVLIAMVVKEV